MALRSTHKAWRPVSERPSAHPRNRPVSAGYPAKRKPARRVNYTPGWLIEQRLTAAGYELPRRDDGRFHIVSVADQRAICLANPHHGTGNFTFNFLRFSRGVSAAALSNHDKRTGISFDSPYTLDLLYDWELICNQPSDEHPESLRNERETPWWGKTSNNRGYVCYGPLDNPIVEFHKYVDTPLRASYLASHLPLDVFRHRKLLAGLASLNKKAPSTEYLTTTQCAVPYCKLLAAALPLTEDNTYLVTRQRALHLCGRSFPGDIVINVALFAFCDTLTPNIIPLCLTLLQQQQYHHVWKRLPERPRFNAHWTPIIYHDDAPEYKRTRAIAGSFEQPPEWEYHPDSPNFG